MTTELTLSVELERAYPHQGRESIGRAAPVAAAVNRMANEVPTFDPERFVDFTARQGRHDVTDEYGYISVEMAIETDEPSHLVHEVKQTDWAEVLQ